MTDQPKKNQGERPNPFSGRDLSFSGKLLQIAALVWLSIFLFLLLWFAFRILLLFFAGVVAASFIRSMSVPLARLTRFPLALSNVIVFLGLFAAGWLAFVFLAPQVGTQYDMLKREIPSAFAKLEAQVRNTAIGKELLSRLPSLTDLLQDKQMLKQVRGIFSITLGVLGDFFLFLFAGIYLAFDPGVYIRGMIRLVPAHYEERAARLFEELATALRRWIAGRLVGMALVGLMTGLGLRLLGVPLALTLGLLSGLLTFIPYLGAAVSAVPAVLIALLFDPMLAFWVVCLYLGAHTVEAYIVTPLIQQHQVQVPPVLTLMVQIVMAYPAGLLGLTLATPLAAMVLVLVKVLYVEDVLGKKVALPGGKTE